ncbi:hypothetical protein [Streptomyces sp. Ag109_O5-10]|uniref:hypothetical protein n=1 Tax=Streptomyces sp. Ag109_O5-10 TaxID=1855349 RepID=UPI000B82ED6E|nr:hypothetical protein [Streptomyces sp. Ag109_O5-10]
MPSLLEDVLEAHGGLDRWNRFTKVTATVVSGGELFVIKGTPQDPAPRQQTVWLHEERASLFPFGAADRRSEFTPDHLRIVTTDGKTVAERDNPRESFAGHVLETPWDALDRAYFNGYAMWTYFTTPFLFTLPGFEVTEIAPWHEGDQVWHGLDVTFPPTNPSHSEHQQFYFGPDNLLRRHDYHVDVAGGFAAAQYVYDIVEADGIRLPSVRRAFRRDSSGRAWPGLLMVAIDVRDVHFVQAPAHPPAATSG